MKRPLAILLADPAFEELIRASIAKTKAGDTIMMICDDGSSQVAALSKCLISVLRFTIHAPRETDLDVTAGARYENTFIGLNPDGTSFERRRSGRVGGRLTFTLPAFTPGEAGDRVAKLDDLRFFDSDLLWQQRA